MVHAKRFWLSTVAALGLAALAAGPTPLSAQQQVAIDNDDIGGVVSGPNGPEAGVWVIAETRDLPTRYAKMVVTDDQGRYVVPDLPSASYKVWVRGYGLVDSPKVRTAPGKIVDLRAVVANRHLSMYDPATGKITLISTCFPTHHLVFAEDASNTLWTSAGGPQSGVVGWLNRKMFEETGDEVKSQGWTPFILDTNEIGRAHV